MRSPQVNWLNRDRRFYWIVLCWTLIQVVQSTTVELSQQHGQDGILFKDDVNSCDSSSLLASPLFTCPNASGVKAENDFDDYWTTYKEMGQENLADTENFRERGYDYRAHSYTKMKEMAYRFKEAVFGDVLESGDHIYESACGQGLNLFMTLEILQDCCDITNLTVHGNDYLSESVHVAHRIMDQEKGPWFNKGSLCQGDSTNLSFVPSNAFDLAYTGFIDPLLDPLNLMDVPDASMREKEEMIEEICESRDPKVKEIALRMQELQEDWFAKWVSELLRIVKPGKYIVIEDVGWAACSEDSEWGGVDPEWWEGAVDKYGWDVDVDSIEILLDDPYVWYENRYNVVMRRLDGPECKALDLVSKDLSIAQQRLPSDIRVGA